MGGLFPIRFFLFESLILGSTLYALLRGGAPERSVGFMLMIAWLLSVVMSHHNGWGHFHVEVFLIDLALFAGLYLLSLFTSRYWPLWMCAMQGLTVLGHALALLASADAAGYAIWTQFWGYPIQGLLIVATRRHQRRLKLHGADPAWAFSRKLV